MGYDGIGYLIWSRGLFGGRDVYSWCCDVVVLVVDFGCCWGGRDHCFDYGLCHFCGH